MNRLFRLGAPAIEPSDASVASTAVFFGTPGIGPRAAKPVPSR